MEEKKRLCFEEMLVTRLQQRGWTVATAESCTGGLIAGTIVNVAGASEVFNEGYVTYSNKAKRKLLGVKKSTLEKEGAVSKKCAREMCLGVCKAAKAEVGISVTGIAGPDGGTKDKPVGCVYVGCCVNGTVHVEKCRFTGDRSEIRHQSVEKALKLACECIEFEHLKDDSDTEQ